MAATQWETCSAEALLREFFAQDDLSRLAEGAGALLSCPLLVLDDTFHVAAHHLPLGFSDAVFQASVRLSLIHISPESFWRRSSPAAYSMTLWRSWHVPAVARAAAVSRFTTVRSARRRAATSCGGLTIRCLFVSRMKTPTCRRFTKSISESRCPNVLTICCIPVSYTHLDVYKRQCRLHVHTSASIPARRAAAATWSVSYTHLDVYKRQGVNRLNTGIPSRSGIALKTAAMPCVLPP